MLTILYTACDVAAISKCQLCTDVGSDGKSSCTTCKTGYTLKDDKSECIGMTS